MRTARAPVTIGASTRPDHVGATISSHDHARHLLPAHVVVVGAGMSGAACARVLRQAGVPVTVRELGRRPGGRLGARTLDRGGPDEHVVDLGAAYFTVSDDGFAEQVADWQRRGLARPWTDTLAVAGPGGLTGRKQGPVRWAGPGGLRVLVEDVLTGVDVRCGDPVRQVRPGPTVDAEQVAAVVLAMPDPQAAALLDPALGAAAVVADRPWEPVLSAWGRWPARDWPDFGAAFVNDHPVLSLLADDGARRGDLAPVLVAHSSGEFARPRLVDPQSGLAAMVEAVRQVLGIGEPAQAWLHRWSLARPAQERPAGHHLDDEGIGLCGDGWGSPRLQTAWRSGTDLGLALVERLA